MLSITYISTNVRTFTALSRVMLVDNDALFTRIETAAKIVMCTLIDTKSYWTYSWNDFKFALKKRRFFFKLQWKLAYFPLECFDTVGWATGRASELYKSWVLVCWWWRFDRSFTRHIAAVVSTTFTLSSVKSKVETFWYRLTKVHLEKAVKMERVKVSVLWMKT